MKKLMFLIFAVFLTQIGFSQEVVSEKNGYSVGIKIGLNSSNVNDEDAQTYTANSKFGLAGGFFMEIPIGKTLGFQPEVLISQKGFKRSGETGGVTYSYTKTTTYVDVPLLLRVQPLPVIVFLVGPQYSYLISEKNQYSFANGGSSEEYTYDRENDRKNNLGALIGLDMHFEKYVLSGRMGWDFFTNEVGDSSTSPLYKNKWVQLTLGMKF